MVRFALLLLAAWPAAAHADVTATYDFGRGMATMVIEADDSGAARSTHAAAIPGAAQLFTYLTPDGRHYVAWQADGAWVVADFEDVLAVMREGTATGLPGELPGRSSPWPKNSFF